MAETIVKICGVRTGHHATIAAAAGADMVGLILAESRRRVTPDEARAVTAARYERRPRFVGVFVNENIETIARLAGDLRLDLVQLSGAESPDECAALRMPYIKAVHVRPGMMADDLLRIISGYSGAAAILLDSTGTTPETAWGGSGKSMDFAVAAEVVRRLNRPVLFAGGLTPETVAAAVNTVRPWGVDVSSGVETDGVKDETKITAFVAAAKGALPTYLDYS